MEGFSELVIKIEPECKGGIDEKNSTINLRPVGTFIRGNPCPCDGVTQPGFRLADLCGCLPNDKGVFTNYLQINGKVGFTSDIARL